MNIYRDGADWFFIRDDGRRYGPLRARPRVSIGTVCHAAEFYCTRYYLVFNGLTNYIHTDYYDSRVNTKPDGYDEFL